MKILIVNTAENKGGAAVACNRLHKALLENGHDSKMLVRQKNTNDKTVFEFTSSSIRKRINLMFFFFELLILKIFKKKGFDFSLPWFGPALHKHPLVLEADVIHLHWIQNSFITINCIKKIQKLNKPIIWTLHDMWAFTGGCHYNVECRNFETSCNNCPQLNHQNILNISKNIFDKKLKAFSSKIQIVTPSRWLAEEASKSRLLKNNPIEVIPYNIDFNIYKPIEKRLAKDEFGIPNEKKVILFVSMNIEDERKGFEWFKKSIIHLESTDENWINNHVVLAIGRNTDIKHFETEIYYTGRLSDPTKISMAYAAADVFVAPSLQDNLPNTVIESLACGTPVVAFNIGGMPDMINHKKNGYLANFKDYVDLATGIQNCLSNFYQKSSIESAKERFDSKHISNKYIYLYNKLLFLE